jgi:hypothetical protein
MAERKSIWSLILIPAVITLAVTILRLVGELEHWPSPLFSDAAGGGLAIVGITWLPIFFGPWFALKLAGAGEQAPSAGKAIGFAFLGSAVFVGGGVWASVTFEHLSYVVLVAFVMMLIAAFIPGIGWPAFGRTLVAYAFAARIPVLVVMFMAMQGNGGKGWGTHYDVVAPMFAQASFARKYVFEAFLPQMTLWIGWTVCVGALVGTIVDAIARRGKSHAAPSAG